ncbi:MAG TPA: PHB depolymerase family esterase, partial [Polyangiales bacterium]|nr:PHB depolymerase family esterase [Polyangiales bacterium]
MALLALAACDNGVATPPPNGATGAGAPAAAPPVAGTPAAPAAGSGGTGATARAGTGAAPTGGTGSPPLAGSKAVPADPTDPAHDDAGVPPREDPVTPDPEPVAKGDWVAGDYPKDLMSANWLEITGLPQQSGGTRQYKVHVPPGYDPKKPTPVVFCLHGLGQDALLFCVSGADMPKKSDAAGFILVMPNGYQNSWNAGTCCGAAVSERIDELPFFRAMYGELDKHLNVDAKRVYATGLSNGGYMSYRLACEASDIFAAVAPGSGAIGIDDIGGGTTADGEFEACKPTQKVSVLDIHGTADPLIPYATQKPSLERIAMQN